MSADITKDPSGSIILPRKLPLIAVIVTVSLAFGFGGWAATLEYRQRTTAEELENASEKWGRVEQYMCMDCAARNVYDCTSICGMRRLEKMP
jgi:hypothetical protein